MGAEKTKALVLKVLLYRESSCILHLFTEKHGLIHGIAKGIRRKKSGQEFIERGFLIELIVYMRPHRDLHTLSSIHVLEFYSSVRSNIIKNSLRDVAFEAVLTAITESDFHPELYELFVKFLQHLQDAPEKDCHPFALWLFYHRFSQYMGFELDVSKCISCGKIFKQQALLTMKKGGLECGLCNKTKNESHLIPKPVLSFVKHGLPKPQKLRQGLTSKALKRITHLLADYCRYHFDIQKEYKALAFLDEMTEW